jgi:hypothetical protein
VAFSQSRAYFVNILKDQQNFLSQPMIIRLNMTHPFSETLHYDQSNTVENGAVTVPASGILKGDATPAWGVETWFFVGKKQKVSNPAAPVAAAIDNPGYKLTIFESLAEQDSVLAIENVMDDTFSPVVLAENLGVTLGLSEIFPFLAASAIRLIPGSVYLDAAMIPEIAANEYAHYALSPWLGLERRFHVGEGYAHFFAAQITGLIVLQDNAGPYSSGYTTIRGDSSEMYTYANEVGILAAMSSFTFSVLEDLNKALGPAGLPVIVDALHLGLSPSSNLNIDFTDAIFAAIAETPPPSSTSSGTDVETEILQAHLVFSNRGF